MSRIRNGRTGQMCIRDRLKTLEADTGETLGGEFGALFDWLAACLERGSVEEYEFRVSCY